MNSDAPGVTLRRSSVFIVLFLAAVSLNAESVNIVNRTGRVIDLIQAAPFGQDHWSDDFIPDTVLPDGDSHTLDLIGQAPWSFRFMDSDGEVYVLYDVQPSRTGKISVGPEHLARLSMFAGATRVITVSNMTGATISSLRVSGIGDGDWGDDILLGRYIRDGEAVQVEIEALPGALSFDIRFTLVSGGQELAYEKSSVILTDGASIVLSAR